MAVNRRSMAPFFNCGSLRVLAIACIVCPGLGASNFGTVIGIDLGTTYSCVGIFKFGRVEIIANDLGNRITPSYVGFSSQGERLVGEAAQNQLTTNPENTIFNIKRLIGRRFDDDSVVSDIKHFPFNVFSRSNKPYVRVQVGQTVREFSPEEVSAMVLARMKEIAEGYVGETVRHAVVTVPAYFNDAQRQATRNAGKIAGLNVIRILNEPTAAAIAYGLDRKDKEMDILVYDLGGGTFDVTVLKIERGKLEVLATGGDTHLGGEDFDINVVKYFVDRIMIKQRKDVKGNHRFIQKLRREVEKAKRALSTQLEARVEIELDSVDFSETLTRAKFNELNKELFVKTIASVKQVLEDAKLTADEIDEVVLVGGSSRIVKISDMVTEFFHDKKPSRGINADEAVAYGAAVQAGILGGESMTDLMIIDVNPLTLGIEVMGKFMSVLIRRNTALPIQKSDIYTTASDYQTAIDVRIFEGERPMTSDNRLLGEFRLEGIPPELRHRPQIHVTFALDANGILTVTAVDTKSGNENSIVVASDHGLSSAEIDRMIAEAERFAEQDRITKERVTARNDLERFAYAIKSSINDRQQLGGQLDESDKITVEYMVDGVLEWLDANRDADVDELRRKKFKLETFVASLLGRRKLEL